MFNRNIIIFLIIVAVIVTAAAMIYSARQQPYRGVAVEDLKALFQPETSQLGELVIKTYREFRANTVRWSAAYFGCLFGSAFLSAMAALVLKLEVLINRPKWRNDLAASFATIAALLVTLSTTGDFQRKWQANRMAATQMENLAYELVRPSASNQMEAVLTKIQEINAMRNEGIVGELVKSGSKQQDLPPPDADQPRKPGQGSQTQNP